MIDEVDHSAKLSRLRRRLRVLLYALIPCQLLTIIAMPAFPVLFLSLMLPNILLICWVVVLDRRIIQAGGKSFWNDGGFTGFDRS